ncbi:MAG: 4-alpha-glucanotransferase [Lachnospiraceae bacterium]|nr:4-alpha-glucanotransferase [Lachnospiraceae bacterium]
MAGGSSKLTRAAGVLLPVFSLPGRYGIGAFSREAYRFVDFLAGAGQSYWQVLPMGPTSYGDSPYQSFSTYAGNPYFIDIDSLIEEGLLTAAEAAPYEMPEGEPVDYARIYETRYRLLHAAYDRFRSGSVRSTVYTADAYRSFSRDNAFWLEDYSLFIALKTHFGGKSFLEWDKPLRMRNAGALADMRRALSDEVDFHAFLQYLFDVQYRRFKKYANDAGIRIIGDIPIYVAPDSSDVWSHPELFLLDAECVPRAVAGCPPDAFSATGQLWGNPLYRWDEHARTGYAWWMQRLGHAFGLCDVLRIDHFRGFESYYSIPYGHETAEFGHWEKGPGRAFFETLREKLGDVPVIAEDLGFLTPEVLQLVADTGYPGMKVLQFAFDSREESDYLPHNYPRNCVVYTGTHDNDTTCSWFTEIPAADRAFACEYLGLAGEDPEKGTDSLIRAAYASVADTAVIPMQDWLLLGHEARVNHPSTLGGNWTWRMRGDALTKELAARMHRLTAIYGRIPERKSEVEFG